VSLTVFLAVIAAAAMHAGWNAVLKLKLDPLLAAVLVGAGAGLIALPFAIWLGLPRAESWHWLAASVVVHLLYYIGLTSAYRLADMGQVYPVARGSAPLLTTLMSLLVLKEPIGAYGIAGVVTLALGIMTMSLRARGRVFDRKALGFALATGLTITAYTLLDGIGARAAQDPHVYSAWLFVGDGLLLTLFALWWKGPRGLAPALAFTGPGLSGGAMSLGSYWIAIWAMTVAPIGLVAAVRESSVLFGAVIAVVILREPLQPIRVIAAAMILLGLALIRLG
jgi:drug/metabolite transporter (DMT)-like permease